MNAIMERSSELLAEFEFTIRSIRVGDRPALAFENSTVVGFLFAYETARDLLDIWAENADAAISANQFGLRRAGQKAWNAYLILLAAGEADYAESVALSALEEDLTGTRKIARAGVKEIADARAALLSLLPLQVAPQLESVNIVTEIRQRATELPPRVLDAFFSQAELAVVMQALEE